MRQKVPFPKFICSISPTNCDLKRDYTSKPIHYWSCV